MNGANEDPYDWSVQQVVDNLCLVPELPGGEGRSLKRPDPILFEARLRENDINGEVLLEDVDKEVIKNHLGISSFGQIIAVERAIKYLRDNSPQWATKHPMVVDNRATTFSPVTPYSHSLPYSVPPNSFATISRTGSPQNAYPLPPTDQSSSRLPPGGQRTTAPSPGPQSTLRHSVEIADPLATRQHNAPRIKESHSVQPEDLPGHNIAVQRDKRPDISGRYGVESVEITTSIPPPLGPSTVAQGHLRNFQAQSGAGASAPRVRKRLAPTLIATPEEAALGSPSQYYGHNRLAVGNIFYGRADPVDSREFSFQAAGGACGTQRWVSALIKHYLQQTVQNITGSRALALVPYSASRLRSLPSDRQRQQFTMFESRGRSKVSDMDDWPNLQLQGRHISSTKLAHKTPARSTPSSPSSPSPDSTARFEDDEYQDLLIRYPVQEDDEEEIAVYVDDDHSIGSYDDETWKEIQDEREEQVQAAKKRSLSEAEIESFISEVVNVLVHEWRDRKFPAFARKVFNLWKFADKHEARAIEKLAAEKRLASFERSLFKVRQEIASHTWNKAEEVRHQCQSLEAFVFQREEERCLIEALGNDAPPPEPPPLPVRRKRPVLDLPDGEEVLSDDDGYLSDDSMAGFIENNLAVKPPSHNRTNTPLAFSDDDTLSRDSNRRMSRELPVESMEASGNAHATHRDDVDMQFADDEDDAQSQDGRVASKKQKRSRVSKTSQNATLLDLSSDVEEPDPVRSRDSSRPLSDIVEPWISARKTPTKVQSDLDVDMKPVSKPRQKYVSQGNTHDDAIAISSDDPAAEVDNAGQADSASDVRTPRLEPSVTKAPKTPRRLLRIITSSSSDKSPGTASPSQVANASASSDTSFISPGRFALKNLEDHEGIRNLSWDYLERIHDHKRVLAKIIYTNSVEVARTVQNFINSRDYSSIKKLIPAGLQALRNREQNIPDISQEQSKAAFTVCTLYASYASCKNLLGPKTLENNALFQSLVAKALAEDDYQSFLGDLSTALQCRLGTAYNSRNTPIERPRKRKNRTTGIDDSSDDIGSEEDIINHATPHKKRVKKVKENQAAIALQKNDQQRVQEFDLRRSMLQSSFQNVTDEATNHIINLKQPLISIHPHIGRKIKEHQVLGTQFLWREIVADPKHQGCLLAHTMGLGKTMQVITLLATIALAAQSQDAAIRKQVNPFSSCRFLILCPPSLVDNWADEFAMWVPEEALAVRTCRKISSVLKAAERADTIINWHQRRGPLIISYEMLRGVVTNKKGQYTPEEHERLKNALLDGPDVVVADEAHKMKNSTSKIAQAASLFRTKSRIALTGSPLANNLDEYFAMIDWIAQGYLGSSVQFRAKYAEPIEQGLFNDSSSYEQRRSLKKLEVLKKDLDPKVCRADISAIAQDLPPKTEFFITVALTLTQRKAYEQFVAAIIGSEDPEAAANARLWDWLAILSLLCNHPQCFCSKLEEREQAGNAPQKKVGNTDDPEGDSLPVDVGSLSAVGLSQSNLRQLLKMFEKMEEAGTNLGDPIYSNRTLVVNTIINRSIAEGDKVLIFSHSIPTLDYLQEMLATSGHRYTRLDGSTAVSKRQEATKDFNRAHGAFDVFLISTKAGGLGLNLPGANRVIIFDFGFNPQWEEQAIGRAYRLGQRKPVFVYRFRAGGTFEEVIYNKAVFKTQLSARVVDKKNPMRSASKNVRDYLFKPKTMKPEDLTEFEDKDRNVLGHALNSKHILKIQLTETFQREHKEELTAEEEKEIREELEEEQLKRDDFAAWYEKDKAKRYQQSLAARQTTTIANTDLSAHPGTNIPTHMNGLGASKPMQDRRSGQIEPPGPLSFSQRVFATFNPRNLAANIMSTSSSPSLLDAARGFTNVSQSLQSGGAPAPDASSIDRGHRSTSTGPHHDTLGEYSF